MISRGRRGRKKGMLADWFKMKMALSGEPDNAIFCCILNYYFTHTFRISPMYILCMGLPLHCVFRVGSARASGISDWDTSFLHSRISQASEKALAPEGVVMGVRPAAFTLSPSLPEL